MSVPPIAANLLRTEPELRLIGSRNRATGQIVFPAAADAERFEPVDLPHRGTLWSYTVQRFPPKSPPYLPQGPFVPFAVGYVDLPGALIVESRLIDVPFEQLRVGLAMELTTFTLRTAAAAEVLMFAFRPLPGVLS